MNKQLKLLELVDISKNLNLILTKKIEFDIERAEAKVLFVQFAEKFAECINLGFSRDVLIDAIRSNSSEEEKTNVINNMTEIMNDRFLQSTN